METSSREHLDNFRGSPKLNWSLDDDQDTGLGMTGSIKEEEQSDNTDSSEEGSDDIVVPQYYEVDSDTAHQMDTRYQQILTEKNHGVVSSRRLPTDFDSVQTEDFEETFHELTIKSKADSARKRVNEKAKRDKQEASTAAETLKVPTMKKGSGLSKSTFPNCQKSKVFQSVPAAENSLIIPNRSSNNGHSTLLTKDETSQQKHQQKKKRQQRRNDDLDSLMSEEYESRFRTLLVKDVASVPITSFNPLMLNSELNLLDDHLIRQKLQYSSVNDLARDGGMKGLDAELTEEDEEEEVERNVEGDLDFGRHDKRAVDEDDDDDDEDDKEGEGNNSGMEELDVQREVRAKVQEIMSRNQVANNGRIIGNKTTPYLQISEQPNATVAERETDEEADLRYIHQKINSSARKMFRPEWQLEAGDSGYKVPESEAKNRRQSVQIKRELEEATLVQVKRAQPSAKPARSEQAHLAQSLPRVTSLTLDNVTQLQAELFQLQSNVQRAKTEKKNIVSELQQLREAVKGNRRELKTTDEQLKQRRALEEDVQSDLVLVKFKRDAARKELERLQQQATEATQYLQELKAKAEQSRDVIKQARDLGVNKDEMLKVLVERDDLLDRVGTLQEVERRRDELERQLAKTTENFLEEQKGARERIENQKEELKKAEEHVKEAHLELDKMRKKLEKAERMHSLLEQEKAQLTMEKNQANETLKRLLEEERSPMRVESSDEARESRRQLQDTTDQLNLAHKDCNRREEENKALSEEVKNLKSQIKQVLKENASMTEMHRAALLQTQKEKDESLITMKRNFDQEKKAMEQCHQESIARTRNGAMESERALRHQLADLDAQLAGKVLEADLLQDRLEQLEVVKRLQMVDKMRQETDSTLQQQRWKDDHKAESDEKLERTRSEYDRVIGQLREELKNERDVVAQQQREIGVFKRELDSARAQAEKICSEKMQVIEQLKDAASREKRGELEKQKAELETEAKQVINILETKSKETEIEVGNLKAELSTINSSHHQISSAFQQREAHFVEEINDLCSKMASALGVSPRLVHPSFHSWFSAQGTTSVASGSLLARSGGASIVQGQGYTRADCLSNRATEAALMNAKASSEELCRQTKELQQDVQTMKQALIKLAKDRRHEVDALWQKMQTEKAQLMENLKNRLIKEHLEEISKLHRALGKGKNLHKLLKEKDDELGEIQKNLCSWKEQTTEKLAKKFQEEMSRELERQAKERKKETREWETTKASLKREIKRLEHELPARTADQNNKQQMGPSQTNRDIHAMSSDFQQLQSRLRQLEIENSVLQKSLLSATSTKSALIADPNLFGSYNDIPVKDTNNTALSTAHSLATMRLRAEQMEKRATLAEDRAAKNEQALDKKMLEMSRIQSSFTQQSKVLLQLEHAYSKLQQQISA